jgi:hypothetical protein
MSRTNPRLAMARSTLASLLAGNSLPRRPGQVAALVEVLAAELNEPGHAPRFMQAWSRLVAARSEAEVPAAPAPARSCCGHRVPGLPHPSGCSRLAWPALPSPRRLRTPSAGRR